MDWVPKGFLGSRADALLDLVVCAFVIYLPIFLFSIKVAKKRRFERHRWIQTGLLVVLGTVVLLFELSVRSKGGAAGLFAGSRYAGTRLLLTTFYVHLSIASGTFLVWLGLLVASHRKWGRSLPGAFSQGHRQLGYAVLAGLVLTVVTSVQLYVIGMVL